MNVDPVSVPTYYPKSWGGERWLVNIPEYCSKILDIYPQKMCSVHFHREKDETFTILTGVVCLEIFGEDLVDTWLKNADELADYGNMDVSYFPCVRYLLHPFESIRIQPLTAHRFIGVTPVNQILETSTQHKEEDSYRVISASDCPVELFDEVIKKRLTVIRRKV